MSQHEGNEEYQFARLTASGQVKIGAGCSGGFVVASGTPTIELFDSLTGSGIVILGPMVTTAGTPYPLPAQFVNGLYAAITGTGDVTFFYQ